MGITCFLAYCLLTIGVFASIIVYRCIRPSPSWKDVLEEYRKGKTRDERFVAFIVGVLPYLGRKILSVAAVLPFVAYLVHAWEAACAPGQFDRFYDLLEKLIDRWFDAEDAK